MTDERTTDEGPDSAAMKALLKGAMEGGSRPREGGDAGRFVAGVQRTIRRRSRGRFFADGWSTSSTRINYALVAVVMLVLVVVVYVALGPIGVSAP